MTVDLTEVEIAFLKRNGIAPTDVLDARRMSKREREERARSERKSFLLGVECGKGRHRLRTVAGHCIQCNTAAIAFQGRHRAKGYVYVAWSSEANLIKVGGSESLEQRERSMKGYGGAADWKRLKAVEVEEYGVVERAVQDRLNKFAYWDARYERDGKQQQATELFRCAPEIALAALDEVVGGLKR